MGDVMARSYNSWLTWWKTNTNSEDYIRFVSAQVRVVVRLSEGEEGRRGGVEERGRGGEEREKRGKGEWREGRWGREGRESGGEGE